MSSAEGWWEHDVDPIKGCYQQHTTDNPDLLSLHLRDSTIAYKRDMDD